MLYLCSRGIIWGDFIYIIFFFVFFLIQIIFHIIRKQLMKATKLPYKVQFQPEYQTFQQRMGKLPIPPINPNTTITPVEQLIDLVGLKEKIKDDQLEFAPSSIYSQYATPNILKEGKKNISELCPGCGDDNSKPIQCQFCGVMYCKKCCWRARVIPTLSQPKQSHKQCEDCHSKYVKLLVNQKFYDQSAIFQKIVDSCSGRVKKLQKDIKTKKQRYEIGEKKKKQSKIKENMILKELKDEQKKVQALQLKLQQIVNKKAERLRQEQERREKQEEQNKKYEETKRQQEQDIKKREQQNLRRQRQIQQNLRRQKQIEENHMRQKQLQIEREAIRKKQEQTRLQIQKQQRLMQQQRRKQIQKRQQMRKIEQKKAEQFKNLTMENRKQILSDTEHKKQTDQLRNLAKAMMKQPQHLNEKNILHTPDIVITTLQVDTPSKTTLLKKQSEILFTPKDEASSPLTKNRKSNNSQIQDQNDAYLKSRSKLSSNNDNDTSTNTDKKQQKGELTQSTQKAAQNHLQLENSLKADQKDKQQNAFSKLPQITIDIAGMTVNQLLGIHVDPYGNQNKRNTLNRRVSQRQSYQEQKRASQNFEQSAPAAIQKSKSQLELTQQQKLQILRSSVSSSLLHSAHTEQEVYANPDPIGGNKCTCNLM